MLCGDGETPPSLSHGAPPPTELQVLAHPALHLRHPKGSDCPLAHGC